MKFFILLGFCYAFEMIDVYKNGEGGYKCIRIPSLLRTFENTILAFAEARRLN